MPPKVVCVARGVDEIDNALQRLDESKVQLLFTKFPVGTGTFKRSKFLYIQYIGPKCSIVKRGQGINEIQGFTVKHLHGVAGFSTTDKGELSFESIVHQMRNVFVTDNGTFSMEQIRDEYKTRLQEERKMMHQENAKTTKKKVPAPPPRAPRVTPAPKEPAKPDSPLASKTPAEMSAVTQRVMASLRQDDGPVNWAVFAPEPSAARVISYGRGGIFEMVKNLPEDQWLFGLFRISFFTGQNRQRRIILFQWIGNKLKASRNGNMTGIYPGMAKLLEPFSYEIYLVGQADLNPQKIITKSKSAFNDLKKLNATGTTSQPLMQSIVFTEDNYRASLMDEQQETKDVPFDPFQPLAKPRPNPKGQSLVMGDGMEQSLVSMATTAVTEVAAPVAETFDVEETVDLVQLDEGGLVWAIFEAR